MPNNHDTLKFKHSLILRFMKAINVLVMIVPIIAVWYFYYAGKIDGPFYFKGNILVIFLYCTLFIAIGRVYDAFQISSQRIAEIVYSQILTALVCNGILYVIICLLSKCFPNILPGIVSFFVQIVFAAIWAVCAHKWYFRTFRPVPTAVIYDTRYGLQKLIDEYGLQKKYDVKATVKVQECLANIEMLKSVRTVFLSGIHSHERNIILKYCILNDISVFVVPRIGDTIMSGATPRHMFHLPILQVERASATPEYLFIKRSMDIVISIFAIVLTSPIMLITTIVIKSEDNGPVLYRQIRLTKDGKQFVLHKFRSMKTNAEQDGVARLSSGKEDTRVTAVGRIIRKFRIDELPQLFDILAGTLSIVGPRPERLEIAEQYCRVMPEFSLRLQVKAGLTGYAQVYGKYNTTPYDKLQMDLMYIAHPSLVEDIKIMLATIKTIFTPESTEGIAEGQITAIEKK